jgi:hypothetical protein
VSLYADTSFLISWHTADARFPAVAALRQSGESVVWTPWQQVEFNNAMRLLLFRKLATRQDLTVIMGSIQAAVEAGDLVATPLPAYSLWEEADRLSRAHTPSLGVRTLDLLHVAAARTLRLRRFLTFDLRQHALAQAAGLTVN